MNEEISEKLKSPTDEQAAELSDKLPDEMLTGVSGGTNVIREGLLNRNRKKR